VDPRQFTADLHYVGCRVSDPYSFDTDPKIDNNLQLEFFLLSKTTIYLSLAFIKDVLASEEAFSPQKRTSRTSKT
jgi:hypothetical protein